MKSRRASSAVSGRGGDATTAAGSSKSATRLRSNSSAAATQRSHANATATTGLLGGLRKFQFLRRKTVNQLRIRQPLMEQGGCVADGSTEACSWNSHRKDAAGSVTAALTATAATAATSTAAAAAATTTSNYYSNNSNNRNSSSGSYSIDGSSAEGSNRAGGILLVTTTAVHTIPPNACTYNNNLHLDGNKIADEAL